MRCFEGRGAGKQQRWAVLDLPDGGGDPGVADLADQTDRQIAEGGHDSGTGTGLDLGCVSTERDVADQWILFAGPAHRMCGQDVRTAGVRPGRRPAPVGVLVQGVAGTGWGRAHRGGSGVARRDTPARAAGRVGRW